jgi:hypothetical protein
VRKTVRDRLVDGLLALRGELLALPAEREDPQKGRDQKPEENQVLSHGEDLKGGFGTSPRWKDWATVTSAILTI